MNTLPLLWSRVMKTMILFFILPLGTYGSIAVCQTSPKQLEWKEYVYPSEGFAISLPSDAIYVLDTATNGVVDTLHSDFPGGLAISSAR